MKFYLAPMEGITTYIYRNAFSRYYGGIDTYFTPFLSNRKLSSKEIREITPAHNNGIHVIPQIMTNKADTFLEIGSQLSDYGYTEVNFNLGCPSGTVVAKKRGAGFLSVPEELDRFLDEVFTKCSLDISIKTRIGIEADYEWEELLDIYKKYPIKELIIHPRFQKEQYGGTPHRDAFLLACEKLSCPLCYNGDITSVNTYQNLMEALKAKSHTINAVMCGRGILANPELPEQLSTIEINTANATPLSNSEALTATQLETFHSFHDEILEGYEEYMSGDQPVLFKMKELWAYMRHYVGLSDKEFKKIRKANRLSDYKSIIRNL